MIVLWCIAFQRIHADESSGQPSPTMPLVLQGRITGAQVERVSLKTPDLYPGGQGIRPQFVIAGRLLRVDVSHAPILLSDGKQLDTRPLKVGDYVLMVLSQLPQRAAAPVPGASEERYLAILVERLACADNVTIQ